MNTLPKNHIYINNTIEELMAHFEEIKNRKTQPNLEE